MTKQLDIDDKACAMLMRQRLETNEEFPSAAEKSTRANEQ